MSIAARSILLLSAACPFSVLSNDVPVSVSQGELSPAEFWNQSGDAPCNTVCWVNEGIQVRGGGLDPGPWEYMDERVGVGTSQSYAASLDHPGGESSRRGTYDTYAGMRYSSTTSDSQFIVSGLNSSSFANFSSMDSNANVSFAMNASTSLARTYYFHTEHEVEVTVSASATIARTTQGIDGAFMAQDPQSYFGLNIGDCVYTYISTDFCDINDPAYCDPNEDHKLSESAQLSDTFTCVLSGYQSFSLSAGTSAFNYGFKNTVSRAAVSASVQVSIAPAEDCEIQLVDSLVSESEAEMGEGYYYKFTLRNTCSSKPLTEEILLYEKHLYYGLAGLRAYPTWDLGEKHLVHGFPENCPWVRNFGERLDPFNGLGGNGNESRTDRRQVTLEAGETREFLCFIDAPSWRVGPPVPEESLYEALTDEGVDAVLREFGEWALRGVGGTVVGLQQTVIDLSKAFASYASQPHTRRQFYEVRLYEPGRIMGIPFRQGAQSVIEIESSLDLVRYRFESSAYRVVAAQTQVKSLASCEMSFSDCALRQAITVSALKSAELSRRLLQLYALPVSSMSSDEALVPAFTGEEHQVVSAPAAVDYLSLPSEFQTKQIVELLQLPKVIEAEYLSMLRLVTAREQEAHESVAIQTAHLQTLREEKARLQGKLFDALQLTLGDDTLTAANVREYQSAPSPTEVSPDFALLAHAVDVSSEELMTLESFLRSDSAESLVSTWDPGFALISTASQIATLRVPAPPEIIRADEFNGETFIHFLAGDSGGSPILGFTVTCNEVSSSSQVSPIKFGDWLSDEPQSCYIVAINSLGSSDLSEIVTVNDFGGEQSQLSIPLLKAARDSYLRVVE